MEPASFAKQQTASTVNWLECVTQSNVTIFGNKLHSEGKLRVRPHIFICWIFFFELYIPLLSFLQDTNISCIQHPNPNR